MLAAMAYPHVVKVNEEELEFLSNSSDLSDGSERLMSAYPNIMLLAVTRGADGSYFQTKRAEGFIPGFSVDVVETTRTGDGFVAGMLHCLLAMTSEPKDIKKIHRIDLARALGFANAVAALTTTKPGAITALPCKAEVEKLLRA